VDEKIVQGIVQELCSSLETLDTQSTAVLQFMKSKGMGTDDEIAACLEEAGKASSVRWRAARARIDYLVAGAFRAAEKSAETESRPHSEGISENKAGKEETGKNVAGETNGDRKGGEVATDKTQQSGDVKLSGGVNTDKKTEDAHENAA